MKAKIGISVGLLGALLYLTGMFCSFWVLLIVAGYVLIAEENPWLRHTAVKAVLIVVSFLVLDFLLSLLPDLVEILFKFLDIVDADATRPTALYSLFNWVGYIAKYVKNILLAVMAVMALKQGDLKFGPIDNMVKKHLN